jgi:hypothetical protein
LRTTSFLTTHSTLLYPTPPLATRVQIGEFLLPHPVVNLLRHYTSSLKFAGSIPDEIITFSIHILLSAALWPSVRLSL